MKSLNKKIIEKPIILLLAFNIILGLVMYRDFGLTWDEPYFYGYADALSYAYSPTEWFSGHFDLYNSYGPSGADHKTRGPAYLLIARNFVYGLNALGSDTASSWHLVNFLFFQLGVYFLYRISKRWMRPSAALFASGFFSFQPMLWGHAFINPKDPPFLTFFLASICLGFEMVDSIAADGSDKKNRIFLAAFVLGIATSTRILAPLAGLLVVFYFIFTSNGLKKVSVWWSFIQYGLLAILVMFVTWPFLWESLFKNFADVFILMSDNPTSLAVLFGGNVFSASELPRRYLPTLLTITLTEPTWPLFGIGFVYGFWKLINNKPYNFRVQFVSLLLVFSYFIIILAYVLIRKPAMYDGMRHFIFVLPVIFIFIGFSFELLIEILSKFTSINWLYAGIGLLAILPGMIAIYKLHPYEYAYYNSFIDGTDGAFRNYETDFWLTCYKDAVPMVNNISTTPVTLFVFREGYVAANYADDHVEVIDLRKKHRRLRSGDYILVNTRTNEDLSVYEDQPTIMSVKRGEATFCVIRKIP